MKGSGVVRLVAGLVGLAPSLRGQGGVYRWTRVSYVQAAVVAIDAGQSDGVRKWSRLEIIRRGKPVALLQVSSLGDHQARCDVVSSDVQLVIGDSVRFLPNGRPGGDVPSVAVTLAPKPVQSVSTAQPPIDSSAPTSQPPASAPAAASQPVVPVPPRAPQPAQTTQTGAAGRPRTAHVTFLTTASVYIDAGTAEGLAEGTRVDVLHRGASVAELKVSFVSTHQASCQVVSKTDTIAVGDSVRFVPVVAATARVDSGTGPPEGHATPVATQAGTPHSGYGRLRGRVGFYYLTVQQRDSFGGRFSQPSGEIRLTGAGLGGSPIGLVADIRSRRLVQALPGGPNSTTDQNRVYQALLYWQIPGSPFRFTTGRQYAPGISSVGLIDGAAIEITQAGWAYGGFAGTSPDPITLGFSGDSLTEFGAYVRRHSHAASPSHWSATAGVSGSYVSWHTNREFFYAQGSYQSRRMSLYAVQEVDYYRAWRRAATGEKIFSPTSTFANLQFQLTSAVTVAAGLDNRRNVRLYQYVVNPAIIFDDTFRRGVWVGGTARFARHFQVSVDARANHDVTNGEANTYTLGLGADRLTDLGLSLRSRSTRYTTAARAGWLNSASLGVEPFGRSSLQVTSGWRTEHDSLTALALNVRWLSLDADVSLGRSLFVILSGYRERGGIEAHDLLYAGFSYRF